MSARRHRPKIASLALACAVGLLPALVLAQDIDSTRGPQAGDVWTEKALDMPFRYAPADTFQMGSPANEEGRASDETQHRVTLIRGFWMAETEVTQDQWQRVMGSTPSHFKECGKTCPVEQVSWFDAVTFANRLSEKAGRETCYEISGQEVKLEGLGCFGFRLPTEAEWEYAARAESPGRRYGELDAIAWYRGNSGGKTHPVAQKDANAWGLRDMLGNVWEWVWDWREEYPAQAARDPLGPARGSNRVARGGGWDDTARGCRAADRGAGNPASRYRALGFRLVRTSE